MRAAKLIDLMMNLVIYPCVVIMNTIVEQRLIHIFFSKPIDNLNRCKFKQISMTGRRSELKTAQLL